MSNKKPKMAEWTDAIVNGESAMPDDPFTFTDTSTYMLDGFDFDKPMGEGTEDGGRLPETKGMSGLPDGLVESSNPEDEITFEELTGDEDGPVLDDMLSEEEGALPGQKMDKEAMNALNDLNWLDPTQGQDPSRLPHNPVDVKPELEEAWGVDRRTDGFHLIPNMDKEIVDYRESTRQGPQAGLPGTKSQEAIKTAILKAIRRSHFGYSLNDIKRELVATLGRDAIRTKKAVEIIEAEHGLAGKVFIRANAFPGLKQGKWVPELKKVARTARYVITDDPIIASHLGMQMVSEVPWKKVFPLYALQLKTAGYAVTTEGDPKAILKAAFLAGPVVQKPVEAPKPVVKPVIASASEAQAEMQKPSDPPLPIHTPEEKAGDKKRKAAIVRLARWVKAGSLSMADALRIRESGADDITMLKAASEIIRASNSKAVYAGEGANLPAGAQEARERAFAPIDQKRAELEAGEMLKAQKHLAGAVKRGLLTKDEAKRIASQCKTAADLTQITASAVQAAQEKRKIEPKPVEAREYKGPVVKAAAQQTRPEAPAMAPEMAAIVKVANTSGIKASEFTALLRWTRQQMSEGVMGHDLNALTSARFSKPLLKAAKSLLKQTREAHEGLSGMLYVDAEAYASPAGSTGCEVAASKHRANGLKFVLSMSRCDSCVNVNADKVCQQYNKRLVATAPVQDVKAYQKKALELANATDAENTAAMFNPTEFGLHNASVDEIGFEGKAATPLENIVFGGMDVETKE